ncbi:hypothetical protein [Timonella senegalensis]|uniref:hypothetical protein n=1 Tax=Timonella senegalensis TaxID=1465825 RepID=UPI0028AACAF6|nr:hypothetical protein [Timonella senegalensis]
MGPLFHGDAALWSEVRGSWWGARGAARRDSAEGAPAQDSRRFWPRIVENLPVPLENAGWAYWRMTQRD